MSRLLSPKLRVRLESARRHSDPQLDADVIEALGFRMGLTRKRYEIDGSWQGVPWLLGCTDDALRLVVRMKDELGLGDVHLAVGAERSTALIESLAGERVFDGAGATPGAAIAGALVLAALTARDLSEAA